MAEEAISKRPISESALICPISADFENYHFSKVSKHTKSISDFF